MSNNIFGIHAVTSQIKSAVDLIEQLYISNKRQDDKIKNIEALSKEHNISIQQVDNQYLDKMTGNKNHQGVVAQIKAVSSSDLKQVLKQLDNDETATVLALDGITDPQNLGAILRTAECFGVKLVILPKNNSASIDNPAVAKTSSGAINFLKIAVVNNLSQAIDLCKEHGFWVSGTSLGHNSVSLDKFEVANKLVWVMGSEGSGMRRLVSEHCDYLVTIPMSGNTQSLNVSVATGVVLSYTNIFRNR